MALIVFVIISSYKVVTLIPLITKLLYIAIQMRLYLYPLRLKCIGVAAISDHLILLHFWIVVERLIEWLSRWELNPHRVIHSDVTSMILPPPFPFGRLYI